eukprot:1930752-Pleurochrysis_carterae.AAC.1
MGSRVSVCTRACAAYEGSVRAADPRGGGKCEGTQRKDTDQCWSKHESRVLGHTNRVCARKQKTPSHSPLMHALEQSLKQTSSTEVRDVATGRSLLDAKQPRHVALLNAAARR